MNSNNSPQPKQDDTPKWLLILAIIAFVNFFSFMGIDLYLSGSALNGKQENGKFYLGEHGRYKEVSEQVFEYSKIHSYSIFVTHGLVFLLGGMYYFREKINK
jgi:hypothetical protein